MPYCNKYRVRKTWFGKSVLQQYSNGENLSIPYNLSGWVDVPYENAPALLLKDPHAKQEEQNP